MEIEQVVINTIGRIIDRMQETQISELELANQEMESTHPLSAERAMTHARCAYTYRQIVHDLSIVHANMTAEYATEVREAADNLPEWEHQAFVDREKLYTAALSKVNPKLPDWMTVIDGGRGYDVT